MSLEPPRLLVPAAPELLFLPLASSARQVRRRRQSTSPSASAYPAVSSSSGSSPFACLLTMPHRPRHHWKASASPGGPDPLAHHSASTFGLRPNVSTKSSPPLCWARRIRSIMFFFSSGGFSYLSRDVSFT